MTKSGIGGRRQTYQAPPEAKRKESKTGKQAPAGISRKNSSDQTTFKGTTKWQKTREKNGKWKKGYFDTATGLTIITKTSAPGKTEYAVGVTRPRPPVSVLVFESGIYQLKADALSSLENFSEQEIHELVVPKRTLARRVAHDEPLTIEETDKTLRLARVDQLASRVFGDDQKASRWLRKPKTALGGKSPLSYLATEAGARAVEEMLNRIDHGLFA